MGSLADAMLKRVAGRLDQGRVRPTREDRLACTLSTKVQPLKTIACSRFATHCRVCATAQFRSALQRSRARQSTSPIFTSQGGRSMRIEILRPMTSARLAVIAADATLETAA